jgi:hypothetical protein
LSGLSYFTSIKASVLLLQFSTLPANLFLSVLSLTGLFNFPFSPDSWMDNDYFYFLMSLLISYLFGWIMSAAFTDRSSGPANDTAD